MFLAGSSSNLSGVVEIDEFAFSRCHIFVRLRSNVDINCTFTSTHRSGFLPAPTRMTWNDLECPIQLNVRMSHGLSAASVDTSLASLLYSCKTGPVLSEVHDH